ncbi:heterogeneous nuclear ribonucleoprotein Q isoform X3 [Brachypodium distachyon]|uniref:RRM domain-containing protein n=2 Tax=Brachypodium distachyon TaxID=15368 RepID=A0A0Q3N5E3_BRADI|nr:heterogeneous nuclear ribonucleoprotein Q isoform X3 [Brachypodium distachyon]KQK11934.1 hypothetical protein BRADI_1g00517v3 [Brachypodium distachyon]|eukprot:XP_014752604.1 heterogeneous nuclear ribonucleoprotein Q isoform X3 [Brachypodium distachyon]
MTSSPLPGRGRGRRGRGRGRSPRTPPPSAPQAPDPDAAASAVPEKNEVPASPGAACAAASDTNMAAQQSVSSGSTIEQKAGQQSEPDMLSATINPVQHQVDGGEADDMVVKDAPPAQETQAYKQEVAVADMNEEAAENKTAEVKESEVEGGGAKDMVTDVDAQSATVAAYEQGNEGEVDAEQEEEDPEEVVFEEDEEPVSEGQAAAQDTGEKDRARVEEHERMVMSDMAKNRQLKKELEIFVGGLNRDAVEEDIRSVFGQVGDVVDVRLHKDLLTNRNKGFAFVKFATKEQVSRALAEMKNPMIRGKRCGIAASEDNDTLFLGNICNTWTKEAIKKRLLDYGIEGVQSLTLVPDTQNEGQSRGFAFLEFSCHADAMLAFKRLQQPDAMFGHPERTAKVAFAEPIKEPDAEVMAQVKSVFIDGLPPYWDEDRVKDRFKAYGVIERVVLASNMSSAKRNDFGFVNFSTHEAALACIEATNNTELGDDGKSKVKVRVRLSNPLPKSQAVKGGMTGGFRIGYSGFGFNRPGRGFSKGRSAPRRAGFHGGRGFSNHAFARGGRFNYAANNNSFEASPSNFQGRQGSGFRAGGRWQPSSVRHGSFNSGLGRGYPPSRRPSFEPEGDFGGPFDENPYYYADVGPCVKRPYSLMEPDLGYFEPGPPRVRSRFDHYEQPFSGGHSFDQYDQPFSGGHRFDQYDQPFSGGNRYRDSFGMENVRSRDYYGPGPAPDQYGRGTFPSHYRGGHSGGGYHY